MSKDQRAVLDKVFHDHLYAAHQGDFLTFRFTNFVSIMRNYEDMQEYLLPCKRILDLGCGGGYDLLHMAQKHPDKEFWGFDHSENGIERARRQAESLGLSNVRFSVSSILDLPPNITGDLVLLKDAFHHVVDPAALVADLRRRTKRVLLIEPSGLPYPMDYDELLYPLKECSNSVDVWLPGLLDPGGEEKGREDNSSRDDSPDSTCSQSEGEAIENRYRPEEIEEFFRGWKLNVKGTLSIFSIWEPWFLGEDTRAEFVNKLALSAYREIDNRIRAAGVDLDAKHWVIYASLEDEPSRSFEGFVRLERGRRTLADWRCRRLQNEWQEQKIVFDCIGSLPNAKRRPGGSHFIEPGQLKISGVRRDFLFEHPKSSVEYTIDLPPDTEFRGFLGLNPAAWAYPGGRGVTFELSVAYSEGTEILFRETIDPRNQVEHRTWCPCCVDLSRFGGTTIRLSLSTSAPGGVLDYCWAGWGDPVIVERRPGE